MNIKTNSFDINGPGIYRITNTVNGKIYIGSSNRCSKRYAEHTWALQNDRHDNPRLQASVNKHGIYVFEFELVEPVLDTSKLLLVEQIYLDWFKCTELGYNISGLAGKVEMNEATRAKISATKQERGFASQIAAVKKFQQENPERAAEIIYNARLASSDKTRLVSEETLVAIIREYISMQTPSITVLAKKYGMCYSTLAKIFKRKSVDSKYKEFLTKIGFNGESIKDLRKPEIQADLILTQDY